MVLLFLLAVIGLGSAWGEASRAVGMDFYQFWVVGQALERPGSINIYSDQDRFRLGAEYREQAGQVGNPRQKAAAEARRTLETYSSPFLYSVFRIISTGDYETGFRNYRLLTLVCFTFGIVVMSRLLNHSWSAIFGAIGIFAYWFEPVCSDLRVGNVNSLQLAALAAYLWVVTRMRWRYRDVIGGALLGLSVAFKPNLVFVAGALSLNWILAGRIWRLWLHAIGAAFGGISAIVIAAASFGSFRCWVDWATAIGALPDEIITVELGNYAPVQVLNVWLGLDVMVPLAAVLTISVFVGMWRRRRDPSGQSGSMPPSDSFPEALALATGCLLIVLIPRLAWLHYHVLTIPVFLVLWCPPAVRRSVAGHGQLHMFLVALALLVLSINPILNSGISLSARTGSAWVVVATLILFMLTNFTRAASKEPARPDHSPSLAPG